MKIVFLSSLTKSNLLRALEMYVNAFFERKNEHKKLDEKRWWGDASLKRAIDLYKSFCRNKDSFS